MNVSVRAPGASQSRSTAHAFEQEGQKDEVIPGGEFWIHRGKRPGVIFAHARRHHHAGENNFGVGVTGVHAVDDGLEVSLGNRGVDAAQPIVGPEREQEDVDGLAQDPIEPARPAGGGFTAETGIDDPPAHGGRGSV